MQNQRRYVRANETPIDRDQIRNWCVSYAGNKHIGKAMFTVVEEFSSGLLDDIIQTPGISDPTKQLLEMLRSNGLHRID